MSNETRQKTETIKSDTKDTVDEVKHRAQAAGERFSREVQGADMPLGERIKSNLNELGHETQAEIDAAKRDARHGSKGS
jgi:hypothetical protein